MVSIQILDFPKLKSIELGDGSFGNSHTFSIDGLDDLELIDIGNNCFSGVKTFKINEMHKLKQLRVGENSFTHKRSYWGNNTSKSFHILNCESLESLEIGEYSFSDYGGGFELKNCPQLQSLQIGHIKKDSFNFCFCSFEIQGIVSAHSYSVCRSSLSETNCVRELCIPASFNHHYQEYRIFIDQTMDRSPLVAIHRAWTRSSGWERL